MRKPIHSITHSWRVGKLTVKSNPKVDAIFANYPDAARVRMKFLRQLVRETAEETEGIDELVETLKWGEPSFMTRNGSTLRMAWKAKSPQQYAMYFQCTSRLVNTFRMVFDRKFQYEGNRAIVFQLNQKLPVPELPSQIILTKRHHRINPEVVFFV